MPNKTPYTAAEKIKIWGAKFLIEDFYYRQDKLTENKAEAIDKIQTFWMIFSRTITEYGPSEDKALMTKYLQYLKGKSKPLYMQERKPTLTEIDSWFSSKKRNEIFANIYESKYFDYKKYEDLVLAFNIVDGLLGGIEIGRKSNDNLFHLPGRDMSKSESNYILEIFINEKNKGYPLLDQLFQEWVDTAIKTVGQIVDFITKELTKNTKQFVSISNNELHQNVQAYEKNTSSLGITFFLDDNFQKRIIFPNFDLIQAIIRAFSFLNLELFGICRNENCKKKQKKLPVLFVKFPVYSRTYCSNNCAAYAGTYLKRSLKNK